MRACEAARDDVPGDVRSVGTMLCEGVCFVKWERGRGAACDRERAEMNGALKHVLI